MKRGQVQFMGRAGRFGMRAIGATTVCDFFV